MVNTSQRQKDAINSQIIFSINLGQPRQKKPTVTKATTSQVQIQFIPNILYEMGTGQSLHCMPNSKTTVSFFKHFEIHIFNYFFLNEELRRRRQQHTVTFLDTLNPTVQYPS